MFPPRISSPARRITLAAITLFAVGQTSITNAAAPVTQVMGNTVEPATVQSPQNSRHIREIDPAAATAALPNDPLASEQWSFMTTGQYSGAADIFSSQLHNASQSDVVVAIVDSGLRLDHEDYRTLPGYDFISDAVVGNDGDGRDNDPSDPGDWVDEIDVLNDTGDSCQKTASKWHGTAIAGIVGAESENQAGIAGGALRALLLPVRVTGKCGGYVRDLIDGIRWAAGLHINGVPDNPTPARVINLSVGFPGGCTESMQNAIDDAVKAGAILVTAATNSAVDLDTYPHSPASCQNILTIAASLRNGQVAAYSALGSPVFLLGPGGNSKDGIISTDNDGAREPILASSYGYHYGTSLAAAHVSAALATLLSINPELSNAQLQSLLQSSANSTLDDNCNNGDCGYGHLNTNRAVRSLLENPLPVIFNDPEPATAAASPGQSAIGSLSVADAILLLATMMLLLYHRATVSRPIRQYRKH